MRKNFIIQFEAAKNGGVNKEIYTTMTSANSLIEINQFIVHMSKSYFEEEKYEQVYVKVWKWEDEKAAYLLQGVIYDYDTESIYI